MNFLLCNPCSANFVNLFDIEFVAEIFHFIVQNIYEMNFINFLCCTKKKSLKKEVILNLHGKRYNKHFCILILDELHYLLNHNLLMLVDIKYFIQMNGERFDFPEIRTNMDDIDFIWTSDQHGILECIGVMMLRIPMISSDYKLNIQCSLFLSGDSDEFITHKFMDYSDAVTITVDLDYNYSFKIHDEIGFIMDDNQHKMFIPAIITDIHKNPCNPDNELLYTYDIITNDGDYIEINNIDPSSLITRFSPVKNYINLSPLRSEAFIHLVCNVDLNKDTQGTSNALFNASYKWLIELHHGSITSKEVFEYSGVFIKGVMCMLFPEKSKNKYMCPINCDHELILNQNHKQLIQTNDFDGKFGCDICQHWLSELEYMFRCKHHNICVLCIYEHYRHYEPYKEILKEILCDTGMLNKDALQILLSYLIGFKK